jgi:hypothetical protein
MSMKNLKVNNMACKTPYLGIITEWKGKTKWINIIMENLVEDMCPSH